MFTRKDVEGVLQNALGIPVGGVLRVKMAAAEAEQFARHVGSIKAAHRQHAKRAKAPNWDETPYDRLVVRRGAAGVELHKLSPVNVAAAQATLEAAAQIIEAVGGRGPIADTVRGFAAEDLTDALGGTK